MFEVENLRNPLKTIANSMKIITILFLVGVTGRFIQDSVLRVLGM